MGSLLLDTRVDSYRKKSCRRAAIDRDKTNVDEEIVSFAEGFDFLSFMLHISSINLSALQAGNEQKIKFSDRQKSASPCLKESTDREERALSISFLHARSENWKHPVSLVKGGKTPLNPHYFSLKQADNSKFAKLCLFTFSIPFCKKGKMNK